MYAEDTARIVTYLNARRSSVDRQVLAKLRGDAVRGKAASAVIRQALAEHYGLERPTLPGGGEALGEALGAVTAQLAALTEAVARLQSQVATMQAQNEQLQQQTHQLRVALVSFVYGDRAMREQARSTARDALAALQQMNGNGRHEET